MLRTSSALLLFCCFVSGIAFAQGFETDVKSLIDASCIHCHDAETKTPLNMEKLDYDLANPDAFRQLVRIFDRVQDREMPPRSEPRPKRAMLEETLASLKSALLEANLAARNIGVHEPRDSQRCYGCAPQADGDYLQHLGLAPAVLLARKNGAGL